MDKKHTPVLVVDMEKLTEAILVDGRAAGPEGADITQVAAIKRQIRGSDALQDVVCGKSVAYLRLVDEGTPNVKVQKRFSI